MKTYQSKGARHDFRYKLDYCDNEALALHGFSVGAVVKNSSVDLVGSWEKMRASILRMKRETSIDSTVQKIEMLMT